MSWLLALYRQSWPLVLAASLGGLLAGLSGAALVALLGRAVSGAGEAGPLAAWFVALCALHLAAKSGSEIALLHASQTLVLQLRLTLSRKLLATPLKRLQALGGARLLAILTEDLATFAHCAQMLPVMFGQLVVVAACLGYIAWLSWPVFVVLLVCLLAGGTVFRLAQRGPARRFVEVREETDRLYAHFRGLVDGAKELQLNRERAGHFLDGVLLPGAQRLRARWVQGMSGYTWLTNVGAVQFFLLIGVLVFGLPRWLPQQSAVLPTVTLLLLYLVQPVGALLMSLPMLQQAAVALHKAQQLDGELGDDSAAPAAPSPFIPPATDGHAALVLEAVRHRHEHEDHPFSVGPLDLEIPLGRITFITGPNGSGKTTLALLLLGLYAPDAGRIRLGGVTVTPENLPHYRSQFSAVFADFHLFETLIGPLDAAQRARAGHYLQQLEMDHKVSVDGDRFSTLALSSGQRKRLALVSAYLEDRPIYLFDEWASDQDPVFKRLFYTQLLPELRSRGKTVIVITHDDAYFDQADHLVQLQDGHKRRPAALPERTAA